MKLAGHIERRIRERWPRWTLAQQTHAERAIASLGIWTHNREAFDASESMQQQFAKDPDALTKALS